MGLGSGEQYESRFLRECIDGGHAGIGHRRRAVGDQDFPQRVNKQGAGVEQETSDRRGSRRRHHFTSAAAEAFSSNCRRIVLPGDRSCGCPLSLVHDLARSARAARSIWLQALHAFWLLSDDRRARPYGPGGHLRARPIGHVRSLSPTRRTLSHHVGHYPAHRRRSRGLGDDAGSQARRSLRASPRAARGKLLRVHRDHQLLVEFAGEHDEGLRRVFDIQIAPIGTEHLACCAADDHHLRRAPDPMLVRVPFGMRADLVRQEFHFMVTERGADTRGVPVMLHYRCFRGDISR
jgi:hypothetical protein